MKTSVEWFVEEMFNQGYFNDKPLTVNNIESFVKQAKEMEREQIIEAFKQGVAYWNGDEWKLIDIEQWYNETFKSE
jgi:hypothetical protein